MGADGRRRLNAVIAREPEHAPDVPTAVRRLAAGAPTHAVWQNELGGLTFEVDDGAARRFVKWAPAGSGVDLTREVERLRWLAGRTPVPVVLDTGDDGDGSWIVTRALPGRSAVDEYWLARPAVAVAAIGAGLRAFHDALTVRDCPFSWRAADRIADARRRRAQIDPRRWWPEHQHLSVDDALALVAGVAEDDLVVCHGDTCSPNTLVGDDGRWSGHVDLGACGVADRWADLAIATWSTEWNYGPGWEGSLLDAYGIDDDPERSRIYRVLWELDP